MPQRMRQQSSQGFNRQPRQNPENQKKSQPKQVNKLFVYYLQNNKQEATYYIPAYLRVKMKNITELSHQSLQGSANMVLILDINTEDLDQEIIEYLKRNLIMRFNRDDAIILDPKKNYDVKMKNLRIEEKKFLRFILRKVFKANMKNSARWTPQETIQLIVSITLPAVEIHMEDYDQFMKEHSGNQKIKKNPMRCQNLQVLTLRFNFMDLKDQQYEQEQQEQERQQQQQSQQKIVKFSFSSQTQFGQYIFNHNQRDICYSNLSVYNEQVCSKSKSSENTENNKQKQRLQKKKQIKNKQKNKQKKNKEFKQFKEYCHAHIIIPLQRNPTVATWTLIVPLFVLGFFNTAIFTQGEYLPERYGNWITLMIAFVAFIPVIRDRLPPNPTVTFMEGLLITHIFATILGFFDGFYLIHTGEKSHVLQITLMYLSGLPLVADVLFFFFLLIRFCCNDNRKLSKAEKDRNQTQRNFSPDNWDNKPCKNYFSNHQNKDHILAYAEYKQKYEKFWDKVRCSKRTYNQKIFGRIKNGNKSIEYDDIEQICKNICDQYISQKGLIMKQKMQSESD